MGEPLMPVREFNSLAASRPPHLGPGLNLQSIAQNLQQTVSASSVLQAAASRFNPLGHRDMLQLLVTDKQT